MFWGKFKWLVFSTQGRAGARHMWLTMLFYIFFAIPGAFAAGFIEEDSEVLSSIFMIMAVFPAVWLKVAVGIKRCHDLGYSGYLLLIGFIPLANLVLLALYLIPGDGQANKYGQRSGYPLSIESEQPTEGVENSTAEII